MKAKYVATCSKTGCAIYVANIEVDEALIQRAKTEGEVYNRASNSVLDWHCPEKTPFLVVLDEKSGPLKIKTRKPANPKEDVQYVLQPGEAIVFADFALTPGQLRPVEGHVSEVGEVPVIQYVLPAPELLRADT